MWGEGGNAQDSRRRVSAQILFSRVDKADGVNEKEERTRKIAREDSKHGHWSLYTQAHSTGNNGLMFPVQKRIRYQDLTSPHLICQQPCAEETGY